MSAITTPPKATDAGLDFNYEKWTAGTIVQLANVTWDSAYRDIWVTSDRAKVDKYIADQNGPTFNAMTYAKAGHPVKLNLPFNSVYKYNYLRAYNPAQPVKQGDTARAFYYFITGVEYAAPNTTIVTVQLDVWQTFGNLMRFGNSYIERSHIGIANQDQFDDNGRTHLTVPEGLDVGGEYQVVKRWTTEVASARHTDETGEPNFDIMVMSNTSLLLDPGTVTSPNLNTAQGSLYENLPNACEIYIFSRAQFAVYLSAMKDKPWVTQGIVAITAVPKRTRYGGVWNAVSLPTGGPTVTAFVPTFAPLGTKTVAVQNNWRTSIDLGRYFNLKKFFTSPYMVCEVTAYTGTPVILKPESWADPHATIIEIPHFAPPNPRLALVPHRYNASPDGPVDEADSYGIFNDGGEWLNTATGIFNFPTFSLLNSGFMSFMASNTHSIAFQHQNADWSQQKALQGNQTSYDVASSGIDTSRDVNRIGNNAAAMQNQLANQMGAARAVTGVGQNLSSGISGGPLGAVGGVGNAAATVANAAISQNERNAATTISIGASNDINRASTGQASYANDANKSLADWAAKGDYQNQIAAINAKVQDARLTQPSVSGQVGGDAFNLATSRMGYDVKVRMVSAAVMRNIGEYWLRYGYAVNQFAVMPPSLMVMEKFTYWKLRECYLTGGPCPETFKQAIRGIFEKGVTVWANPADIGTIDIADNTPLTGVTL